MSESSKVWKPLKRGVRGLWERVENTAKPFMPDTDYCIDGQTGKVELKYLKEWPKRARTVTDLGISRGQALWLNRYKNNGGRGFVLARVGKEWLLLSAQGDLTPTTKEEWIKRTVYYDAVSPDFDIMLGCFISTEYVGNA